MARIRTIKPELWQDEDLATVSIPARLLFVGLITQADDKGRQRGDSRLLRSLIFPYGDESLEDVERWLGELARVGRIVRYEVDGRLFVALPNWERHQRINRPTASRIPAPEAGSLLPHGGSAEDVRSQHCGSGGEGSGKEGSRADVADLPTPLREVHDLLLEIFEHHGRGKRPSPEALQRVFRDFPDKDHLAVAREYAHWQIHGDPKKPHTDVVAGYRNQLKRADDLASDRPAVMA